MGKSPKLALMPVNVRVGDFAGNLEIHRNCVKRAVAQGSNLVVFPELSLVGYSPKDLLFRPSWIEKAQSQLDELHHWLLEKHPNLAVVVGTTCAVEAEGVSSRGLANCAVFLLGERRELRAKTLIPFYDVFGESRYFDSAASLPSSFRSPISWEGKKLGLLICEDSWDETLVRGQRVHRLDPTKELAEAGCDLLLNLSASPYDRSKKARRRETLARTAADHRVTIAYVNHFGAQDEILFDGDAFVHDESGRLLAGKDEANGEAFFAELGRGNDPAPAPSKSPLRDLETMLVVGIRDYAVKNGFRRAVLGLSGGIDSALVASLACRALGPENVIGIAMPSKFSSVHSVEDAEELGKALGLTYRHLPIKMPHSTFAMALQPFFAGLPEGVAEENVQSRLRGVAVMAFANKFGALGLATGNKSEFAMGYATLYGDMCGALAPIGDLYKGQVYELARFLNKLRPDIPERTFTKAPSAELRPGQTDQDSLPPYDLLDAALRLLVEEELEPEVALPLLLKDFPAADLALLKSVQRTVRVNEYKRRQAPPILRVSPKAFGSGRIYPITCLY